MNVLHQDTKTLLITDEERKMVDQEVRRRLQPPILQFHIINLGMLAIVVVLFFHAGLPLDPGYSRVLLGLCPGFALAFYMAMPGRNEFCFQYSGIVFGACATLAYRCLGEGLPNLDFWLIPMCLLLTFTAAIVFASVWRHLLYTVVCWGIMFKRGNFDSGVPGQEPLIAFLIVSGIGLASSICLLTDQTRRRSILYMLRLERLANYDALTGLRNRRSFLEFAESTLARRTRLAAQYFLLIDVDNFKRINDELGHGVGDMVLKQVADVISSHAGQYPSGRLGGEEFGILLSDLETRDARVFVDDLLAVIEHSGSGSPRVTASIGVALHQEGEALSELIRRADVALYEAKRAGKNCWVGSGVSAEVPASPPELAVGLKMAWSIGQGGTPGGMTAL